MNYLCILSFVELLPFTLFVMDMDKKDAVDLLHPLSALEWNQVQCPVPGSGCMTTQCIILNDKLYLATSDKLLPRDYDDFPSVDLRLNVLAAFSLDFKECVKLNVPVEGFALTHYHSQLVLVGGEDPETKEPTNQVLVSADGTDWKQSLPPMKEKRTICSAVNTMCPESLVVVGCCKAGKWQRAWTNTIEVFTNGEWFTVQPHPEATLEYPKAFVHNGIVIILDWKDDEALCYSRVESLLAYGTQPQSLDLWKRLEFTDQFINSVVNSFVSFGRHLVGVGSKFIEVLCPTTHTWFRAGSLPNFDDEVSTTSIVLPTGELLVLFQNLESEITMHKASMKLLPCNLDGEFSEAALERLNAVGFRLYRPLLDNHEDFIKAIGISNSDLLYTLEYAIEEEGDSTFMSYAIDMWTAYEDSTCRPATWRSFFDLLKELGLAELSQQISDYLFTDFPSLKEQSMAVIMSGLLQQRLEPDQLHAKLPDYIPTTLRNAIVHNFKARTLQLVPKSADPIPGHSPTPSSGEESLPVPSARTSHLPSSPAHSTMSKSPSPSKDLLPPEPKNMKLEN